MTDLTFFSKRVYTGSEPPFEGYVRIFGSKIVEIGKGQFVGAGAGIRDSNSHGEVIDLGNNRLMPGLIDLHVHGSAGLETGVSDLDGLHRMAAYFADDGVTSFQPTTGTAAVPVIDAAIANVLELTRGPVTGARSLGLHMEGPFLNPLRKGSMSAELMLKPDAALMERWLELGQGTINHVTLAPELPGALELVSFLKSRGVTASAGHTNATYDEMIRGFEVGITLANHTYNAMRELHHREPGALGAAFTHMSTYCELIADGIHVHPAAMRLLVMVKGQDRVVLITDAIGAAGLPPGQHTFLGKTVTVDESGACRLADGTLAGSTAKLRLCVKNMVEKVGLEFGSALRMATVNPAKVARVFDKKGSIASGKDADLVVLNDEYGVLWSIVEGVVRRRPDAH